MQVHLYTLSLFFDSFCHCPNAVVLNVVMEMQGAAEDALSKYSSQLQKQYEGHMAQKLGLQKYDKDLAVGLMSMMYEDETGIAQAQEAVIALFL